MKFRTIFIAAFLAWWIWPMVDPHWEQDRCSFGSVSNEEYRAMLKEANSLIDNKWPSWRSEVNNWTETGIILRPFSNRYHSMNKVMFKRVKKLSDKQTTIDGKVAAMHAVLRAHGASYKRSHNSNLGNKPESHPAATYYSEYSYKILSLLIRSFSWWHFIIRWTGISIFSRPNIRGELLDLHRAAKLTNVGIGANWLHDGRSCPPVFSHISKR